MTQPQSNAFDQIIWPEKRLDNRSEKEWEILKNTIRILCQLGEVTKWTSQRVQEVECRWPHVPLMYKIDGLEIKFSPNDSFCEVGEIFVLPPTNKRDFQDILQAIKIFQRLGSTFGLKISDKVYGGSCE